MPPVSEHGRARRAPGSALTCRSQARLTIGSALALGLLVWSAPHAAALTITNRDAAEARLTIIAGALRDTHTLAPGAVLKDVCVRGCIVRLADQSEWELSGSEVISLEGGVVYYDGEEADRGTATQGANPAPSQQRQPLPRRAPGGRAPL